MMMVSRFLVLLAATSALAACDPTPTTAPAANNSATADVAKSAPSDPIASAMTAAPASLAKDAAIIAPNPDGTMKMLREGTNGFTCMPGGPTNPVGFPMCMDANGANWMAAWRERRPPSADAAGLIYMLSVSPGAAQKSNASSACVRSGPHIMIVGSPTLVKSYAASAQPGGKAPFVMSAGTPYAHLIVPVG